ncbi:MAG: class I SAM-dependent methyltransferase, partial [Chloroflexota bacterium]
QIVNLPMSFYTTVARYYDAENADKTDDIAFYRELAEEYDGPILDIGCGSGRVVLPLARDGRTVHGIDNNAPMLERAHKRVAMQPDHYMTLTLQEGDVLTDDLPDEKYSMILLSYNMLMHFHEQTTQITLLERMRYHIADDGVLVIDLPNAGEMFATPDSDAVTLERTFVEPETGHMVMQQAVSTLDRATQFMRVQWIYDEITDDGTLRRTVAPTVFRYFFPYEVQLLLRLTGFTVEQMFGDTDGSPFEDGSPRMIVIAIPTPDA